jgi:hypothetical protein
VQGCLRGRSLPLAGDGHAFAGAEPEQVYFGLQIILNGLATLISNPSQQL